jgi:hypothetical protein
MYILEQKWYTIGLKHPLILAVYEMGKHVGFVVLTAVVTKSSVFRDIKLFSPLKFS